MAGPPVWLRSAFSSALVSALFQPSRTPKPPPRPFNSASPESRSGFVFSPHPRGKNSPQSTPKTMNISHSSLLLLIDSKNYPCFRPVFTQFFPLSRASRPRPWVRFSNAVDNPQDWLRSANPLYTIKAFSVDFRCAATRRAAILGCETAF